MTHEGVSSLRRVVPAIAVGWYAVASHAAPRAASAKPPTWTDVPALLASAAAPVADDLRACAGKRLPLPVALVAMRGRDGDTTLEMPLPGLGGRGPTPQERCLRKAVARISLPPLPPEIERITLRYVIEAPGAPTSAIEPAFDDWRDPRAAISKLLDAPHRARLAACDRRRHTIRLVLDLRKGETRVWLPNWQFHAPGGDGTRPPAERRVKACLTAAIRALHPPPLPRGMGELQLAVSVTP